MTADDDIQTPQVRRIVDVLTEEATDRIGAGAAAALGLNLPAGSDHYRAWVGPPAKYDLLGAIQFQALTNLGLRDYHHLCEVGCGSLRAGRLFIPYLLDGHYCAIEPNTEILRQGLSAHFGWHGPESDIIRRKRPRFHRTTDFDISWFGVEFDYVLAQSIISHTGPAETELFLSQCAKAMTDRTTVLFTFVLGRENCTEDGWYYPECVTYTTQYMVDRAQAHGLDIELIKWPGLNNHQGVPVSGQTPALLRRS